MHLWALPLQQGPQDLHSNKAWVFSPRRQVGLQWLWSSCSRWAAAEEGCCCQREEVQQQAPQELVLVWFTSGFNFSLGIGCSKHLSLVTCLSWLLLKHLLNQCCEVTVITDFTLTLTHTVISEEVMQCCSKLRVYWTYCVYFYSYCEGKKYQ